MRADAVVSWPATNMDRRSSRSWVEVTSSREAIRKRRTEGSESFMKSSALLRVGCGALGTRAFGCMPQLIRLSI